MKITAPNQNINQSSTFATGAPGSGVTYDPTSSPPLTGPSVQDAIDQLQAEITAIGIDTYVKVHDGGQENITAHGNTGSTETFFSSTTGNVHTATLNANCTFTFAAVTSGKACSFTMLLTQDGTGSRLVTWPGSVVWQGGTAPVLATAAASVDILTFFTLDGGTVWYGFHVGSGSGASFATPAIVLGTAAAIGAAATVIRSDATIVAFTSAIPLADSGSGSAGTAAFASRQDHVHPVTGFDLLISDTTADFLTDEAGTSFLSAG